MAYFLNTLQNHQLDFIWCIAPLDDVSGCGNDSHRLPFTKPRITLNKDLTLAPTRKRYSLAQMLKGMRLGDMPAAPGWDSEPRKGREAW